MMDWLEGGNYAGLVRPSGMNIHPPRCVVPLIHILWYIPHCSLISTFSMKLKFAYEKFACTSPSGRSPSSPPKKKIPAETIVNTWNLFILLAPQMALFLFRSYRGKPNNRPPIVSGLWNQPLYIGSPITSNIPISSPETCGRFCPTSVTIQSSINYSIGSPSYHYCC